MNGSEVDYLADLAVVLARTFPDRDLPADLGPGTKVLADLGLASIEIIVLGEKLEQFYGRKLPYSQFLGALRSRAADDLELGEIAQFLRQSAVSRA